MGIFNTSEAAALTKEEMEKLKVAGAGSDIKAKLESCGATGGEVCAAVIIAVEGGKIKGSKWTLVGNLGGKWTCPPTGWTGREEWWSLWISLT